MTYQDKVYRREDVLNEFEITVDVYLNSVFLTNDEMIELIKRKHEEIKAKLDKIQADYNHAPKPEDPFKD